MKSLNIILIALIAIVVTGFILIISIADLQAPTIYDDTTTDMSHLQYSQEDGTLIDSSDTDSGLSIFENQELGIRFEYPVEWGELEVEINDAAQNSAIDSDATWRKEALVSIPNQGIIMSTYTDGEIMGRGGYWADYVSKTQDAAALQLLCHSLEDPNFAVQPSDSCSDFTNLAGINFIQLSGSVDWYGENTNYVDLYLANHPNHEYYGIAFSTQDLADDGEVSKEVAEQIYRLVMSLEFID